MNGTVFPKGNLVGLTRVRELLEGLIQTVEQGRSRVAALQEHLGQFSYLRQEYLGAKRQLGAHLYDRGWRVLMRRRAIRHYRQATERYATYLLVARYLDITLRILKGYAHMLRAPAQELTAWVDVLSRQLHKAESHYRNPIVQPEDSFAEWLVSDPQHPWLRQLKERYLPENFVQSRLENALVWGCQEEKGATLPVLHLQLNLGEEVAWRKPSQAEEVLYDALTAKIAQRLRPVFHSATILLYAMQTRIPPKDLLAKLTRAHDDVLPSQDFGEWYGQLLAYKDDTRSQLWHYLARLTHRLREDNLFDPLDSSVIQDPLHYSDPQMLAYLYVREKINVYRDVPWVAAWQDAYRQYLTEARDQHVLSAERNAVRLELLEQRLELLGQGEPLPDDLVLLLGDLNALVLFWLAYSRFGWIAREVQQGQGVYYVFREPHGRHWQLTAPGHDDEASLLREALLTFLAGRRASGGESDLDAAAIHQSVQQELERQITTLIERIDRDELGDIQYALPWPWETFSSEMKRDVAAWYYFLEYANALAKRDASGQTSPNGMLRNLYRLERWAIEERRHELRKRLNDYMSGSSGVFKVPKDPVW